VANKLNSNSNSKAYLITFLSVVLHLSLGCVEGSAATEVEEEILVIWIVFVEFGRKVLYRNKLN